MIWSNLFSLLIAYKSIYLIILLMQNTHICMICNGNLRFYTNHKISCKSLSILFGLLNLIKALEWRWGELVGAY